MFIKVKATVLLTLMIQDSDQKEEALEEFKTETLYEFPSTDKVLVTDSEFLELEEL